MCKDGTASQAEAQYQYRRGGRFDMPKFTREIIEAAIAGFEAKKHAIDMLS
jgi:hypothetical protein